MNLSPKFNLEDAPISENLNQWSRLALTQNQDDVVAAVDWLTDHAKYDPVLRDQLLRAAAKQAILLFYRLQRKSAVTIAKGRVLQNLDEPEFNARLTGRLARVDFWTGYTVDCVPLHKVSKAELLRNADRREGQARGQLENARFERAVAAQLTGDDQRVGDVFTPASLQKLAHQIYGEPHAV